MSLKALGALSQVQHLSEAETIYCKGDPPEKLYIINRGVVGVASEDAKSGIRGSYLSRGDVFGDVEVLTNLPRIHSVRTCEPVSLQCFDRADFPELIRRVPTFFYYLSTQLATRLLQAHDAALSSSHCRELSGNLTNFDLVTIYQTIVNSGQTGELSISNEDGELVSAFFFEAGLPTSGQFQHLAGEEAFWQLFQADHLRGNFSFSSGAQTMSHSIRGGGITHAPDYMLITALQYRDELHALRAEMPDPQAHLARGKLDVSLGEISPALAPIAEEVWRRLFGRRMSLLELGQHLFVCELKIYQAVHALVRAGHLTLSSSAPAEKVA